MRQFTPGICFLVELSAPAGRRGDRARRFDNPTTAVQENGTYGGQGKARWLLTWPAALLTLDCPTSHKTDNPRIGFGLYLVAAVSRRFQAVCTASAHLGHIIKFNFGDRAGPRDPPSSAASSRPDWAPAISQRRGLFLFRPGAAIAIPANCSTRSAVIARRHGLHSNVCISGKPPIDGTVREKCIASPQLGQIAN